MTITAQTNRNFIDIVKGGSINDFSRDRGDILYKEMLLIGEEFKSPEFDVLRVTFKNKVKKKSIRLHKKNYHNVYSLMSKFWWELMLYRDREEWRCQHVDISFYREERQGW